MFNNSEFVHTLTVSSTVDTKKPSQINFNVIKSTIVLLKLGMGQVLNGRLYVRYRSSSQRNEAEELKKLTDYFPLLI